ncbi:G protein-activated inward rectifier potassium channel 3-like [Salminus brasiliensis]|uniref:G protein-activated inward rectifier potassium channel 3-like n=1 Tax=Salminus brasiliensis TaxID=930266 RepID=UPI003B8315DA
MVSTVTCSNMALQECNGVKVQPMKLDHRRNSIPPAQFLTAKHLLAYLPRPALESARYSPYPKAGVKSTVASAVLNSQNTSFPQSKSFEFQALVPVPACQLTYSLQNHQQAPGGQEQTVHMYNHSTYQDEATQEPSKPHHTRRSLHLTSLSTKWRSTSSSSDHCPVQVPEEMSRETFRKQRCKLLGEEQQVCLTTGKQRQRYITKDGKCRVNLGPIEDKCKFLSDIFTTLVDLRYRWFLFVFTMCYIGTWVVFAEIYFVDAWLRDDVNHVNDPNWQRCFENVDSFLSALLLSVESQRTIGYGSRMVTANCIEGAILLMAQSIIGSIIDSLMVGCMFVKISRPQKRAQTLIFSKRCVISERDENLCLLFRIGDLRESHMVDAKIRAKLIKSRQTKEGEFIPLEQSEINLGYDTGGDRLLLVEPQTITHIINESSPFWEIGAESLKRDKFEIIVILEGIVEASGMTCQARTSYTEDEILWGHRFESCISLEKGAFRVDYSAFDKTFEVQTSPESAKKRLKG